MNIKKAAVSCLKVTQNIEEIKMQSEKIIKMQLEEKKAIFKALKENNCLNKEQILSYTDGYIAALNFVLSKDISINYVHISNSDYKPFK